MTTPERDAKAAARHLVRLLAAASPEGLASGGRVVVDLFVDPPADGRVRVPRIRVLGPGGRILHDGPGSVLDAPDTPAGAPPA